MLTSGELEDCVRKLRVRSQQPTTFKAVLASGLVFNLFFYASNCQNLPELAFACCVAVEKEKRARFGRLKFMDAFAAFDDYNVGHGEC